MAFRLATLRIGEQAERDGGAQGPAARAAGRADAGAARAGAAGDRGSRASSRSPAPRSPISRPRLARSSSVSGWKGVVIVDVKRGSFARSLRPPARRHHRADQRHADRRASRSCASWSARRARRVGADGRARRPGQDRHGALEPAAMSGLFEAQAPRPLADRLRPQRLEEIVGQDHLIGPNAPIGRMLAARQISSMILWGPPGCGKTTLARLIAEKVDLHFELLSAVFSGVADLRKIFEAAQAAPPDGPRHAAVHRRDPSLQPQPAGRLPAACRGRHHRAGRRHHREPVLRAERRACCRAARCSC